MVPEAAQVAGLRQDGQGMDRPDARDLAQELVVAVIRQHRMSEFFDLIPLADEAAGLGQHHAEHRDRRRAFFNRQSRG